MYSIRGAGDVATRCGPIDTDSLTTSACNAASASNTSTATSVSTNRNTKEKMVNCIVARCARRVAGLSVRRQFYQQRGGNAALGYYHESSVAESEYCEWQARRAEFWRIVERRHQVRTVAHLVKAFRGACGEG